MEKEKEKEYWLIKMVIITMDNGMKIIQTVKGNIFLSKQEDLIMANGKMVFTRVKANKIMKMGQAILESLWKG